VEGNSYRPAFIRYLVVVFLLGVVASCAAAWLTAPVNRAVLGTLVGFAGGAASIIPLRWRVQWDDNEITVTNSFRTIRVPRDQVRKVELGVRFAARIWLRDGSTVPVTALQRAPIDEWTGQQHTPEQTAVARINAWASGAAPIPATIPQVATPDTRSRRLKNQVFAGGASEIIGFGALILAGVFDPAGATPAGIGLALFGALTIVGGFGWLAVSVTRLAVSRRRSQT